MRNYKVNDFFGSVCEMFTKPVEEVKPCNEMKVSNKTNNINITINLGTIRKINRIEPFSLINY